MSNLASSATEKAATAAKQSRARSNGKGHLCKVCNKRLSTKHYLKLHLRMHSGGERDLACNDCGRSFFYKSQLRFHLLTCRLQENPRVRPHPGAESDEVFSQKSLLKHHRLKHSKPKTFTCDVCGKTFLQEISLKRHLGTKKDHKRSTRKLHACSLCEKSFRSPHDLLIHHRSHSGEKPYSCDVCNKRFSRKNSLDDHSRVHTGENPFVCAVCGKSFTWKINLVTHLRAHTGEKPFSCDICNRAYVRKQDLKLHVETYALEGKSCAEMFTCEKCGRNFPEKRNLTMHLRFHI